MFPLLILLMLTPAAVSWNVLIANVMATRSHQTVSRYLANLLAEHGHHVTYLSTNIPSQLHPAVVQLDMPHLTMEGNRALSASTGLDRNPSEPPRSWSEVQELFDTFFSSCEMFYKEPNVQSLIQTNTKKFDLFFTFVLFDSCGLSLAHKLGIENTVLHSPAPVIFPHHPSLLGLPLYCSTNNIDVLTLGDSSELRGSMVARAKQLFKMTVVRFMYTLLTRYYIEPVAYQNVPDYPGFGNIYKSVRAIFMHYNPHPMVDTPHPLGPGVVALGGTLCKGNTDLPPALSQFISTSDSFIYISFGTLIKKLPTTEQQLWFQVARRLHPINIVLKSSEFDGELPSNVFIDSWLPQMALLQHPKIKAFVTHGGYASKMESFCFGVPLVFVPRFALDQYQNARIYKKLGIAENVMDISSATVDEVFTAVSDSMSKHASAMKEIQRHVMSTRVTDEQVMGYIDMAISGKQLLPGYQPWWQLFYLDIIVIPIAVIYLVKYAIRKIRG